MTHATSVDILNAERVMSLDNAAREREVSHLARRINPVDVLTRQKCAHHKAVLWFLNQR